LDAPAPVGKAAAAPLALRVVSSRDAAPGAGSTSSASVTRAASVGGLLRDTLQVQLGDVFHANYKRQLTETEPKVLSGAIAVGVGATLPTASSDVRANVRGDDLDLDGWLLVARKLKLDVPGDAPQGKAVATDAAPITYTPTHVTLKSPSVVIDARRMTNVDATLTQPRADGVWMAQLSADQLAGAVQWRPARVGIPPHVQARFSRLSIPAAATTSVEAMLTTDAPAEPPSLDIVVDALELKGRPLGRLEVDATHERSTEPNTVKTTSSIAPSSEPATWQLNRLRLTTPEAQWTGTGRWMVGTPRRMVLDFTVKLEDSGTYLTRLGYGDVLRAGRGSLSGQVTWAGSPLALHLPSLSGRVNVNVDDGQFMKVNAGAARLLGVLSLQSLPRRLLLDFRDVFSDGFAFDTIDGDVRIAQGQALTNNLRMRSVQAVVLMEGGADLVLETQNLNVWVVPEINAGTASLVYAAINPAVGLGTFLAQLFLRRPLMEASTRKFQVTGSWADPQMERVERPPGDRVPTQQEGAPVAPSAESPASLR
jgi:uncharacterized protein YhdP